MKKRQISLSSSFFNPCDPRAVLFFFAFCNIAFVTSVIILDYNKVRMAKALEEQRAMKDIATFSFEERLALLLERETVERANRRLAIRLKKAKLRHAACFEDIDLRTPRGLDKSLVMSLGSCSWISKGNNVLITGPTGVGKSYLACALAHKACLEGYSALYIRLPRLMEDLVIARGDGRYGKLMRSYSKIQLLVLDDWG